jgi:signal peptidase I
MSGTVLGSLIALLYLAFTIVPRTGLYATFVITSQSMEPAIARGSVVIVTRTPPDQVRLGDVITFSSTLPPYPTLTHRVLSIDHGDDGLAFQTKGDANLLLDPWQVSYAGEAGVVRLAIPLIGYALVATSTAAGQLILGLFLAGVLAAYWFTRVWRRPRVERMVEHLAAAQSRANMPAKGPRSFIRLGIVAWLTLALVTGRAIVRLMRP